MELKKRYNFATAISMVIGVVIGSGIFFKADDILAAVNGNVALGLLGFVVVGLGVIFGALTISYYALVDQEKIGMIGYSKLALGRKFAFIVGWFSVSIYFPALVVVLAMITAIYIGNFFNIDSQVFVMIMTAAIIWQNMRMNYREPNSSGNVQVLTTIAKMIPLFVIGFIGMFFFDNNPVAITSNATDLTGGNPYSMLIMIAFAFDGWIVATNIAHEIKDSKRNLPRALAFGTLVITLIYSIYFFGISQILSPSEIVSLGDAHTAVAAQVILGPLGGKLITLFVIISVYGGMNGMTLAYLRLPELLVEADLMKDIFEGPKRDLKMYQFTWVWIIILFIVEQLVDFRIIFTNLDEPFDISSVSMLLVYIIYIALFMMVNKFTKGESNAKRTYYLVLSILASIPALIVVYGAMQTNGIIYVVTSTLFLLIGIFFYKQNKSL